MDKSSPKSAKKLVQARLPFKSLSTTVKNEISTDSVGNIKLKDNLSEIDSKEIQNEIEEIKLVKDKTILEIIISSDEESDKCDKDNLKQESFLSNVDKQSKTPDQKTTKVFIKLPINSKKKKRKSNILEDNVGKNKDVSLDQNGVIESVITCNPSKKIKISDFVKQKSKDGSSSFINDDTSKVTDKYLRTGNIQSNLICDEIESSFNQPMEIDLAQNENISLGKNFVNNVLKLSKSIEITSVENAESKEIQPALEINITLQDEEKINKIENIETYKNLNEKFLIQKNSSKNSISSSSKSDDDQCALDLMRDGELENSDTNSYDLVICTNDHDPEDHTSIISDVDEMKECTDPAEKSLQSKSESTRGHLKHGKNEARLKEKEARKLRRIEERKEKEEKRRKEKEEKEKKRLAEIEAKSEEKKLKDEEKRKREELKEEEKRKKEEIKEEDRKKKEEEKRKKEEIREEERRKKEEEKKKKEIEKEEMENKKKKAAQVFTKFFVQPRASKGLDSSVENVCENFMPFQVKEDMKLAPVIRKKLDVEKKEIIDAFLKNDEVLPISELYVNNLKHGYQSLKSERTLPKMYDTDEVIIVDEMHGTSQCADESTKSSKKYKAKFLLFCENKRPAYYGTWRKKSLSIKPRRPFGTDKIFDYDVESDLEWEEEEPGESLNGSEDEKESEDDYEVDNDFFVPHGHLSDEELEEEDHTPEMHKAKLKLLQQEFVSEMKKKTEKLKPRLIGVVWSNKDFSKPNTCPNVVWDFLKQREMFFNNRVHIIPPKECNSETSSPNQHEKPKSNKRQELPEIFIPSLIKLVHGNPNKKLSIIKEFQAYLSTTDLNKEKNHFTKSSIRERIESMAQWKIIKSESLKKNYLCWVVSKEYLEKHSLSDLYIQNKWQYIIPPKNKINYIEDEEVLVSKSTKINESLPITKFAKILTSDEREKLLEKKENFLKPISNENSKNVEIKCTEINSNNNCKMKKRVPILFSVPRGHNVPEATKNIAVNDFIKKQSIAFDSSSIEKTTPEDDDCIILG